MMWTNILKIKIRPADEALSPTVQDFLRPTNRDKQTLGVYDSRTGKYSFNLSGQTPESIAQAIAEETTHHAQDVTGKLDADFQRYETKFRQDTMSLNEKYIIPIWNALKNNELNLIPNLAREYGKTYFSLLYTSFTGHIILESHAKESQGLDAATKVVLLASEYISPVIDIYLSWLPETFKDVPVLIKFILPEYEKFKIKTIEFINKMVEDVVFETLPVRTKKFKELAMENIDTASLDALKKAVVDLVINNMEETMDSVKEELNA
jgi:hypothetical protein